MIFKCFEERFVFSTHLSKVPVTKDMRYSKQNRKTEPKALFNYLRKLLNTSEFSKFYIYEYHPNPLNLCIQTITIYFSINNYCITIYISNQWPLN